MPSKSWDYLIMGIIAGIIAGLILVYLIGITFAEITRFAEIWRNSISIR